MEKFICSRNLLSSKIIELKKRFFNMKKCCILLFLFFFAFLFFSCKKIDAPAYLILTAEDFTDCINTDNYNETHETSYLPEELEIIRKQRFTDVLVSLNGQSLGYWQLPCTIPLKPDYTCTNNVRIIPCVRVIQTTLTTIPYSFVTPIELFFDFEREREYRLSDIKFEYIESVEFPVLETFIQSTTISSLDSIYGKPLEIYQNEGKNMGRVVLKDSTDYFKIATPYVSLSGQGVKHFWEMGYQCDGVMTTFLQFRNTITGAPPRDLIVYFSGDAWKKTYIDITEYVSIVAATAPTVSVSLGIIGNRNPKKMDSTCFHFEYIKLISMTSRY
jgi:hypothetical protein